MKKLFICILLSSNLYSFAQFAHINDPEGQCNVRKHNGKTEIIDHLINGSIVYAFPQSDEKWISVSYQKSKTDITGYIYKNRLKFISDYTIIPEIENTINSYTLSDNNITIIINTKKFEPQKHTLSYYKNDKRILEKIDGNSILGKDGGIPTSEYKSIEIYKSGNKIIIPSTALTSLYQPNLENTKCYYDKLNDILYIESMNSDGAGGYAILWVVEKNIYKNRYIIDSF